MKKIFTFIVSTTLFTSAFAQYNNSNQHDHSYDKSKDVAVTDSRNQNDHGYNKGNDAGTNANWNKKDDNSYNDNYAFSNRDRDMQIMKINREYNYKIQDVKNNVFMNRFKKQRVISMLEAQRNDEIQKVYAKFNNRHDRHDDKRSNDRW